MTDPNLGRTLIEEGSVMQFKVINLVNLQDNRDYYILEDPNGMKHFIDAEAYANYGIVIGSKLQCKVDKINCTGRILLEPKHPIYNEGQTYYFRLVSVGESGNGYLLVVEDIFQNQIEAEAPKEMALSGENAKSIKAVVVKFKKGKPIIEFVNQNL